MKTKIIEIINQNASNPKKRFKALLEVFQSVETAPPSQKQYFNASGFSKVNLDSLEYEIKKLYSITDKDLRLHAIEVESLENTKDPKTLSESTQTELDNLDLENADYRKELLPLATKVAEELELELESKKGDVLKTFLQEFKPNTPTLDNPFDEAPEDVKTGIKLRDEFPFLAEEKCPDKFKILVADKMTAYENYVTSSEALQAIEDFTDKEAVFELAKKAVENFELNLEIYDELNHFKATGEILGNHPIFADEMLAQKVADIKEVDLAKNKKNLEIYIARDEKKLDKIEDPKKKEAALSKINDWKKELELIEARIESIKAK